MRKFRDSKTQEIVFVLTEWCNLDCVYCYEKNKTRNRLSADCIKDRLSAAMLAPNGYKKLSVAFFGGEPLLAFKTIKEVIEWFLKVKWPEPVKDVRFGISTNGTVLNDRMKQWFSSHRDHVALSLSMDGIRLAQDRNRSNSYDRVIRHIDFFRKNWPEEPVKMTISPHSIDYVYEGVVHIHSLGLSVDFDLVFEDVWGDEAQQKRAVRTWAEQLSNLVDFYSQNQQLRRPKLFRRDLVHLFDNDPTPYTFCMAGKHTVTIMPNGIAFPCFRFAPMAVQKPLNDILCSTNVENEKCAACPVAKLCPTCEGHNYLATGSCFSRTTFHCRFFQAALIASAKLSLLDHSEDLTLSPVGQSEEERLQRMRRLLAIRCINDVCSPVLDWASN